MLLQQVQFNNMMIEERDTSKDKNKQFQAREFWCHSCQQRFLSHLKAGIDDINCPRCSSDFCQIFTSKNKPNNFQPFQKTIRPKQRRFPRYTAQAVLVALAQYSEEAATEKVREVNQEDVRKLKIKVDRTLDQCLICKEDLKIGVQALRCPCGHVFHIQCLSQWMEYKNNCPKCRAKISNQLQ